MTETVAAKQFEQRFREDYQALFPGRCGWETASLYLLLAYDFAARQPEAGERVDKLKYPLMHALRWGAYADSQPLHSAPIEVNTSLAQRSWDLLLQASDYTGALGAFRLFGEGIIDLDAISDRAISFTGNPSWMAYDELDQRIQDRPKPHLNRPEIIATVKKVVGNVLWMYSDFRDYYPNVNDFRNALESVRHLAVEGFELPESWSFDGISLADLRRFWTGLILFGMVHNGVSHRLVGLSSPQLLHLAIRRTNRLTGWLADSLGLEKALVARLIDLHSYSREHLWPDIALTPLLPIGPNLIAFSPWLVLSSRLERNFCSFVARNHKQLYDASTGVVAASMASRLAELFEANECRAKTSLPIQTSHGNTDIDLLIWSPREKHVLAAELVWTTATADVVEVLRAERKCLVKTAEQLPKYREALSQNMAQLLQRAFNLKEAPQVDGWSCALIAKGFVGSPRLITDQCLFVPEQIALDRISEDPSLTSFCNWSSTMPYVPIEGRDFQVDSVSVISPSGYQATFCERERRVNIGDQPQAEI